jgi:uridine kinase
MDEAVESSRDSRHGSNRVVGLTGATRCGKSRVARALQDMLREKYALRVEVVAQDAFWYRTIPVKIGDSVLQSCEEPECTDTSSFAREIGKAAQDNDLVIAEGFQLLHSSAVRDQLHFVYLLEISMEESMRRRSCARDAELNPHPIGVDQFRQLVWPAHERYLRDCVTPLAGWVRRYPAPHTGSRGSDEVANLVHAIGEALGYVQGTERFRRDLQGQNASETQRGHPECVVVPFGDTGSWGPA